MAKIKAPLFSLDATGTLDKNITYKGKLRDQIAQKYSKPGDKNPFESSPRQKDQRSIIRLITIHWQCMSSADKLSWENAAKDVRFKGTGYHYFLHMAQQNLTQYLGLVGYWSMNYNIDEKIPDLSGNGYHGTLIPIFPCDAPILLDSFNKKQGKALYFDGVDDRLRIGNYPIFNPSSAQSFSVEFMLRFDEVPPVAAGIIGKGNWNVADQWGFHYQVGKLFFNCGNSWSLGPRRSFVPILKKWYFVVGVASATKQSLYFDGELYQELTLAKSDITTTWLLYINGYVTTAYELKGMIDNVLIWNRALIPEEIKKHFTSYNL